MMSAWSYILGYYHYIIKPWNLVDLTVWNLSLCMCVYVFVYVYMYVGGHGHACVLEILSNKAYKHTNYFI